MPKIEIKLGRRGCLLGDDYIKSDGEEIHGLTAFKLVSKAGYPPQIELTICPELITVDAEAKTTVIADRDAAYRDCVRLVCLECRAGHDPDEAGWHGEAMCPGISIRKAKSSAFIKG